MRVRRFCIIVNNYKKTDRETIKNLDCLSYGILGYEIAPTTGTPHIQGYVELKVKKTMSAFQKVLQKAGIKCALKVSRGTAQQNQVYCKKEDENYIEFGEPMKQGRRVDIEKMYKMVEEGRTDVEIQRELPTTYCKYYKAVDRCRDNLRAEKGKKEMKEIFSKVSLRPWQEDIVDCVKTQNDRTIDWVVDIHGNQGKTFLAHYLVSQENAYYIRGGKKADIIYAYNYEPIVVFDFTRCQRERIQYDLIEEFLDGYLFSSKYESKFKYKKDIKVLCLSNFEPCQNDTLSLDRFRIHRFN